MNTRTAVVLALLCQLLALTPSIWGQVFDKVVDFQITGGGKWVPDLALGRDGSIYAITIGDGSFGNGSLIRLKPDGTVERNSLTSPLAQNARLLQAADGLLYTQQNGIGVAAIGSDGFVAGPGGGPGLLIQGSDGNFYGTYIGSFGGGVFRSTPIGSLFSPGSVSSVVVDFGNMHGTPRHGVIEGVDGALYGTTDFGRIFKVTKEGISTILTETDSTPSSGLLLGSDGNFYGITRLSAYRMTPEGVLTTVASLPSALVFEEERSDVIWGSDGAFYMATRGEVYRIGVEGTVTTLATIPGSRSKAGGLTLAPDGSFYGTTSLSKTEAIFRFRPAGLMEIVYEIPPLFQSGYMQNAPTLAADGNLYGVIEASEDPQGFVQISPTGTVKPVASFGFAIGSVRLVVGPDGNLYFGARNGFSGPVRLYALFPPSAGFQSAFGAVQIVATLPIEGQTTTLLVGSDGALYGMGPSGADYVLFKVEIGEQGGFPTHDPSVVATFSLPSEPNLELLQASDGNFYGTTMRGGNFGRGTVFRVTPAGVVTVLAEFDSSALGGPKGAMVEGDDGNFYGTATNEFDSPPGAIFRMTPAGVLSSVATFAPGKRPLGGLVKRSDGRFYGVTDDGGGSFNSALGGVFAVTTSGQLSVVMPLPQDNNLATQLRPDLHLGTDGNLYGSLGGRVYRGLWPGPPFIGDLQATPSGLATATMGAAVNARGLPTLVVFEYGTDGENFPSSIGTSPALLSNYGTTKIGANLTGLPPGQRFYFRARATNSAGTVVSPVETFVTLAEPVAVVLAATKVTPSSARLNGVVNPNGSDTTVAFDIGSDGSSFPSTLAPSGLSVISGNSDFPLSVTISDLQPGRPVFYRLRASNAAGTVVSGVRSFSTLSASTTALGSDDVGVTEATFRATIDTYGQAASVKFKYWADATSALISETAAQTVTTNGPQEVSARVTGLLENVAYSYRVSVELAGTLTEGGAVGFTTDTNVAPVAASDLVFYSGQVVVDPLANDTDPNDGTNANLLLAPALVVAPDASLGVASVTGDRRSISYNPQFNVRDDDALTYRVLDPLGASAEAQVRLIAFSKRAGLYGGKIPFGSGATAREGTLAVQVGGAGALSTSFMNWDGESFVLKGVFDQRGMFTRTLNSPTGAVLTITLTLDPDLPRIVGSFEERAGATVTASVPNFVLTKNAGTGGLAQSGLRTGFLNPPAAQAGVMADGFLRMTVGKDERRGARFAGRLPDGEPFLASAPAQGRAYALVKRIEQGGVFTGLVRAIDGSTSAGGMMGDLLWKKQPSSRARFHRGGVETVLSLSGVAYPAVARGELPPLGFGSTSPNARLRLIGGDLGGSYRDVLLNFVPGSVQIIGPDPAQSGLDLSLNKLTLKVDGVTAAFSGRFTHPATGKAVPFEGALRMPFDGEPGQGRGVFRGPSAAGAVRLEAN